MHISHSIKIWSTTICYLNFEMASPYPEPMFNLKALQLSGIMFEMVLDNTLILNSIKYLRIENITSTSRLHHLLKPYLYLESSDDIQ